MLLLRTELFFKMDLPPFDLPFGVFSADFFADYFYNPNLSEIYLLNISFPLPKMLCSL